jgi:large subunit ribosomal protein L22
MEESATTQKQEEKPTEKKSEEKKPKEAAKPKKTSACVRAKDLPVSLKHAMAISNFIKNKKIDDSIKKLYEVIELKRAIPMRGEIPHKHSLKGRIMSGRYPIKCTKVFIKLLKNLKANAINCGLDSENLILKSAVCNKAHETFHSSGRSRGRNKKSHVELSTCEGRKGETKK